MPKYRVLEPSYIGDVMRQVDEIVDYDGFPGPNLAPVDAEAKKRKVEADAEYARRAVNPIDSLPMTTSNENSSFLAGLTSDILRGPTPAAPPMLSLKPHDEKPAVHQEEKEQEDLAELLA